MFLMGVFMLSVTAVTRYTVNSQQADKKPVQNIQICQVNLDFLSCVLRFFSYFSDSLSFKEKLSCNTHNLSFISKKQTDAKVFSEDTIFVLTEITAKFNHLIEYFIPSFRSYLVVEPDQNFQMQPQSTLNHTATVFYRDRFWQINYPKKLGFGNSKSC